VSFGNGENEDKRSAHVPITHDEGVALAGVKGDNIDFKRDSGNACMDSFSTDDMIHVWKYCTISFDDLRNNKALVLDTRSSAIFLTVRVSVNRIKCGQARSWEYKHTVVNRNRERRAGRD
jgi:hypothetical protein